MKHGLVRTTKWKVAASKADCDKEEVTVTLALRCPREPVGHLLLSGETAFSFSFDAAMCRIGLMIVSSTTR